MVPTIVEKKDREFAEIFTSYLCPSFMARDEDRTRLNQLLESADKEKNFFILFLKKQIEFIDKI